MQDKELGVQDDFGCLRASNQDQEDWSRAGLERREGKE